MADCKPIKVLIVEDDEEDYFLTQVMLMEDCKQSFDVEWISTFDKAVEVLGENRHDVCLVDYQLGAETGLDLLRTGINLGCRMPFILLTGLGEDETDMEALRLGAADYLVKGDLVAPLLERSIRYSIERRRTDTQITEMAFRDPLTGLPNRALFMEFLSSVHARKQRANGNFGLLFLDLDRFKTINDTLGHIFGDELLKQVADRLRNALRQPDMLCRIGGDEFTIILEGLDHPEHAAVAAERILAALEAPFQVEGHELFVTGSIGISTYPESGDNTSALVKNADMAMYRAKDSGRNNYVFHTSEMMDAAVERLDMERKLRRALEEDNFVLHYQPQIRLSDGAVVGMEALVRLEDPDDGLISPIRFIPVAEETGLINSLGMWVLRTACAQNKRWLAEGLAELRVAVNLSARQFQQRALVETVHSVLLDSGLPPNLLELELTEGQLAEDAEQSIKTLNDFKDMGIHVAIDDFGTGYSSLSYLKRFPVHTLKIDRSFVRDVISDQDDAAISSAIIGLSHHLGLEVVAEGVEDVATFNFLRNQDCGIIQGYLISKPLSAEDFREWLISYQPHHMAEAV